MATDYDRREQYMTIECDHCGSEDTHYDDWKECMEYFKGLGWINRKVDDGWGNFCSEDCFEEHKEGTA